MKKKQAARETKKKQLEREGSAEQAKVNKEQTKRLWSAEQVGEGRDKTKSHQSAIRLSLEPNMKQGGREEGKEEEER